MQKQGESSSIAVKGGCDSRVEMRDRQIDQFEK